VIPKLDLKLKSGGLDDFSDECGGDMLRGGGSAEIPSSTDQETRPAYQKMISYSHIYSYEFGI
jgi:hypothetical protein